jgi:predicted nucleic acid-binding protein
MNAVFVDASYWIAFRDRNEERHAGARRLGAELAAQRTPLCTTTFVFAEVYAYFARFPILREQLIHDFWESGAIRLIDPAYTDQEEAIRILRSQRDKDYSFCDAISFVVMRRFDLQRVAAFDDHFRQFGGFEVIP